MLLWFFWSVVHIVDVVVVIIVIVIDHVHIVVIIIIIVYACCCYSCCWTAETRYVVCFVDDEDFPVKTELGSTDAGDWKS